MILKLKSPILLIILSIIFYSCEKEYSVEGNVKGGTAVFNFTGSPGACTNAVITGIYEVGIPLAATNIVTISVNVTTAGTYTVTTSAVNGISFTGSGTFTATGTQVVQLTGSGTPLAAGTFDFSPGTNGCAFSIIVTDSGASAAVYTYNGSPGSCIGAVIAGTYAVGSALTSSNTVTLSVNVTTVGTWSLGIPEVNGFSFSGSGTFTAPGPQTVVLVGTGTPAAAGLSIFTPTNNGCSFNITVTPATTVTDFLTCTIDGVAKTFNVDLTGEKVASDTFEISGNESTATTSPLFGIILVKSPLITTGIYDRFSATNTSVFCLAAYLDGVSTSQWLTGLSPTSTGFSVNVTSYTATPNRITGTFSGTIYSDPLLGTGPKVITAGQFSVAY